MFNMCEMKDLFAIYQQGIEEENKIKEAIQVVCAELDQLSREGMALMQCVHNLGEEVAQARVMIKEIFEKAREAFVRLNATVPKGEYYKYIELWRVPTQRIVFLSALVGWLETDLVIEFKACADMFSLDIEESGDCLNLDIEDYLMGILQFCSELSRLSAAYVVKGDYERPLLISETVEDMHIGFSLLNLKNDHLRKGYDLLKYEMKKIEKIHYDLTVRILPPHRQQKNGQNNLPDIGAVDMSLLDFKIFDEDYIVPENLGPAVKDNESDEDNGDFTTLAESSFN